MTNIYIYIYMQEIKAKQSIGKKVTQVENLQLQKCSIRT